jgi:hypothetical protein
MENRNGLEIDAYLRRPDGRTGGLRPALTRGRTARWVMQRRFVNEQRNQNDVPSEKNQAGMRQAIDGQWARRQSALAQK